MASHSYQAIMDHPLLPPTLGTASSFFMHQVLENALLKAFQATLAQDNASIPFAPDIRLADPSFGDFQANGILPYAKKTQQNPRLLAETLVKVLQQDSFFQTKLDCSVAGPGFINFRLKPAYLLDFLKAYRDKDTIKNLAATLKQGERIVIDYSSPNTAKQMHVGHLRSMVIGEALYRMLSFCGARVVRDNHIGDWGTQFGMLILAIKRKGIRLENLGENSLEVFENLYKEGSALCKQDLSALEEARKELVKLQQGDPENHGIWEQINALSYQAFEEIYTLFGIAFDCILGESFYRDKIQRVIAELQETGLAQESEGALVVFHPEHPRFKTQPFIILKSDGASNYATTDLATALYRLEHFKAKQMLNVVDSRQQDHFEQLALTVNKWFTAKGYAKVNLVHIGFGTILGADGKAIKTRSGESIKLKELVGEAIERAYKIVADKNSTLAEEDKKRIATVIGIGALRYADLSQNRNSDYIFDWDKLLSLEGNTAPYLLYAVARIHSIFRKYGHAQNASSFEAATPFESPSELPLARKLLQFSTALSYTLAELKPHLLCTYLYELSGLFSSFYKAEKVMVEDEAVQSRRLLLCAYTLNILELGLGVLGIETLEAM